MPAFSNPCTKAIEPAFFAVGEGIEYEVYTKSGFDLDRILWPGSRSAVRPSRARASARDPVWDRGRPGALTGRFRQGDPLAPAIVQDAAGQQPQREDHERRDDDEVV